MDLYKEKLQLEEILIKEQSTKKQARYFVNQP